MTFSKREAATLEFVSSIILNGKRLHELIMLQMILEQQIINREAFTERLAERRKK